MKHVVLLTIDTLRRDTLTQFGCRLPLTPFLDSLIPDSTVFAGAHSVAPYTQASFPGILTSSYIFDTPRAPKLSEKRVLVSEALKRIAGEADITTAAFHSNPYLSDFFGWNRGWDMFYDSMEEDVEDMSPYISGAAIDEKVDNWLQTIDKGRPIFLWVHYMDVHEPYVPDRQYIDRVDGSITLSREQMFALFKDVLLPRDASNPETVQLLRKLYQAHVCEVDDYSRRLFDILDKHGILSDAAVIITTDHGDEFGEHGSLSHDGKMYSELVHVPQLIVNPPEAKGVVCEQLVSGVDIAPTILQMFGLESDPAFQGSPLYPLSEYHEAGVYGEAIGKRAHKIKDTDMPAYYYREGKWKIMYRQEEDSWELYNLDADPREQVNRIETAAEAETIKRKLKPRIDREHL